MLVSLLLVVWLLSPTGTLNGGGVHGVKVRARYPLVIFTTTVAPSPSANYEAYSRTDILPVLNGKPSSQSHTHQTGGGNTEDFHLRKVLAPRYKNVFGNSRVVIGSQFFPLDIGAYTGKVMPLGSRKETFHWQPKRRLFDYFLKPR